MSADKIPRPPADAYGARASAPGRVCLAGEDIDWISGPSVLCAIDLRVRATVSLVSGSGHEVLFKSGAPLCTEHRMPLANLGRYEGHVMDFVQAAVKLVRDSGVEIPPIEVAIESGLPVAAGLSSSAAVLVSTLGALNSFFGLGWTVAEICNRAFEAEITELETGAGQMDFYSCGLGGVLYIDSGTVPPRSLVKFVPPENLDIIVVDSLTPHNTKEVIRRKRERLAAGEPLIKEYVRLTEAAIGRMRELLEPPEIDLCAIGRLISDCHRYLRDYMGVSTDLLDRCVEIALDNGALGAKLTGAGKGGCMFAIADKRKTGRIAEVLSGLPVSVHVTSVSIPGLVVHRA